MRLTVDRQAYKQTFEIRKDPREKASDAHLREIEGEFMRLMGSNPMGMAAQGIDRQGSRLSGAIGGADAKPTQQMYWVFEDLTGRFEVQRNRLNQVVEEDLGPSLSL